MAIKYQMPGLVNSDANRFDFSPTRLGLKVIDTYFDKYRFKICDCTYGPETNRSTAGTSIGLLLALTKAI